MTEPTHLHGEAVDDDVQPTVPVPVVDGVEDFDTWYQEARRDPYRFRWAGKEWELPNAHDIDWRLTDSLDKDKLSVDDIREALRVAFGPDQWEQFAETQQPATVMVQIFNRWLAHSGVDQGESSSSGGSSGSTAGPSKRTSTGTTASGSRGRSTAARRKGTRRVNS